jgi:hypothetical protein
LGGVLLFIDNYFQNQLIKEEDITVKKAVTIGFNVCMMPERAGQQLPLLVACSRINASCCG